VFEEERLKGLHKVRATLTLTLTLKGLHKVRVTLTLTLTLKGLHKVRASLAPSHTNGSASRGCTR
jgi:hypothetical protein